MFREVQIIHHFCSSKGVFKSVNISYIFTTFYYLPYINRRKSLCCFNVKKLFLHDFYVIWPLFRFPPLCKANKVLQRGQALAFYRIAPCLSRKKIGWDELLEENENVQWTRWLDDLGKLKEATVDRCFKPTGFTQVQEIQLHLFSDASWQGYSAVVYFHVKNVDGRTPCSFVMGNAQLAPIREISLPRLKM